MRRVTGSDACAEYKYYRSVSVEGKVLHQLVIGSLQERSVHHEHRLRAALCHTGNHCNRMLFRNSDVDKLLTHAVAPCLVHSERGRRCGVDDADRRIGSGLCLQKLAGIVVTALVARGLKVLRHSVVTGLLVGNRPVGAESLLGMNVHDNRMVDVLHCRECIDQRVDIVALFHIAVVKADRAEQVQLARSVRPAELVNVPVDSAVGLRNRHLIVVEYDDEIGSHLCNVIETFKCLAARQGAVSEKCDYIFRSALKVAGLGKPRGKRHGG